MKRLFDDWIPAFAGMTAPEEMTGEEQKKGLMQKLLTEKWRIKI